MRFEEGPGGEDPQSGTADGCNIWEEVVDEDAEVGECVAAAGVGKGHDFEVGAD